MTLGTAFPVEQIVAVSNDTHIYRSWRYRKKKEGKLLADYDSFWISIGGEKQDSGNFMLPLVMPRKPMEEIASKKRSEYRRPRAAEPPLRAAGQPDSAGEPGDSTLIRSPACQPQHAGKHLPQQGRHRLHAPSPRFRRHFNG